MRRCLVVSMSILLAPAAPAAAESDRCRDAAATVRPDASRALSVCGWGNAVEITRAPAHGHLAPQVQPLATMRYTPRPGFTGADSFAFRPRGTAAGTPEHVMKLTVTAANLPPACTARSIRARAVPVPVFGLCQDPDEGDSIHLELAGAPQHGKVSLQFEMPHYTPDPGYVGPDSFSVRAGDGEATSPPATVEVDVTAPEGTVCKDLTVIARRDGARPLQPDCTRNGEPSFGESVGFEGGLAHGTLVPYEVYRRAYVPDTGFTGTDTLVATLLGPDRALEEPFTFTIEVTEQGNAPTCVGAAGRSHVRSGRTVEAPPLCSDADGDALQATVVEHPYRGAVTAGGTYTADAGAQGADRFSLKTGDGILDSGPVQTRVRIFGEEENTAPHCVAAPRAPLHGGFASVPVMCVDDEGDPLTYAIVAPPQHGSAAVGHNMIGAAATYRLGQGEPGVEDSFTYQASDGRGGTSVPTTVRVAAPAPDGSQPQPPSCRATQTFTIRPDTKRVVWLPCWDRTGWLTPAIVDGPDQGTLKDLGFGEYFEYAPPPGFTGQETATLRATNSMGQAERHVVFDVSTTANEPPRCQPDPERITRSAAVQAAPRCSDGDGDALTSSVSAGPAHGKAVVDGGTGAITYTPDAGYAGPDSFTVTADDGHGGTASVEQWILVRGETANVKPLCDSDRYEIAPGAPLALVGLCVDGDRDAIAYAVATPPQHGTLTPAAHGYTYTPQQGFTGTDSLQLTADDGRAVTAPFTVTIGVGSTDAPRCSEMAANVLPGQARPLALTCFWAPFGYGREVVTQPEHGTISAVAADGTVTYTPHAGYEGPDAFTFRAVKDGVRGAPAVVMLDVGAPEELPGDLTDDPGWGPDAGETPEETPQETPEETPQEQLPATGGEIPQAGPPPAPPLVLTPSLRDAALQALRTAVRAVVADLGSAQAFLPAAPPKPGTRTTRLLAIGCAAGCGLRVNAKLAAGRRAVRLKPQSRTLGAGRAAAFGYRITAGHRRAVRRPKRAVLVLDVKVRDADGTVHRDEIRVRLILR